MTVVDIALLALAVAGALARPRGLPVWACPVAAALVSIAIGSTGAERLRDTADLLREPLLFLLAAVPLAALLDELGFFESASALAGESDHLEAWLWLLAGGVTAVLNLDAAVVLLTPLYIRVAAARGRDATAVAFIPALQACLASSALPVSNLTNLLAAEHLDLTAVQFGAHLGLPTLAATATGYVAYRWTFPPRAASGAQVLNVDRRALRVGSAVVAGVLAGFAVGGPLGVPAWVVVLAADLVLLAVLRVGPRLRTLPVGTALLALALGVLASAAARHLDVAAVVRVDGRLDEMRVLAAAAAGAALMNNLPAAIVGVTAIGDGDAAAWPLLLGVNIGALLLLTGSLSNLLWQRAAADAGVHVGARSFTRVGLRVGLPALVAAGLARLALG
jgi:arsenical pump membrane protein